MNIYKEELLDHFRNPRNYGRLENPDIASEEFNPSCGDSIEIQATTDNHKIKKVVFTGKGCVISQSAASMLTQFCVDKSLTEILHLEGEAIISMIGIILGPTRTKCALLPLYALQKGIIEHNMKKGSHESA